MPWSVAFGNDRPITASRRQAIVIIMGQMDNRVWDWDTWRWEPQQR